MKINKKHILNTILNIIFPISCIGCGKRDEILCKNCETSIEQSEKETENNIFAIFNYQNKIIKKAIWDLKYYKNKQIGKRLGEIIYNSMIEETSELEMFSKGSPIIVIPIPISKNKFNTRGYNQAEILARSFCEQNEKLFCLEDKIIKKCKETTPQARLKDRSRRLNNIKDSFKIVLPEKIKGRTVIIIDDVTTTGGTILEVMKILKKSGAKRVVGFAVAH